MCLAQGHNTVTLVGIEPRTSRFRVLRSTTTPPHSLKVIEGISIFKSKMVNKSFILAHKACFVNSSEGKSICMEISNNKVSGTAAVRAAGNKIKSKNLYETVREKTNNLGFQPGPTQTGLYKHRRWLETGNFGFRKMRNCTICVAKTKALISFAVRGYREADLRLCFRLCRLLVFPWGGSYQTRIPDLPLYFFTNHTI